MILKSNSVGVLAGHVRRTSVSGPPVIRLKGQHTKQLHRVVAGAAAFLYYGHRSSKDERGAVPFTPSRHSRTGDKIVEVAAVGFVVN